MSFYSDFAEHYEAVFPFREPVLRFLLRCLDAADAFAGRPARVLDLGCGPGHYCGRLAALGHEVTGVDLDPAMIAAAARAYPGAAFHCLDLLDLDRVPPPFAMITCIGNVLPHVPQDRLPGLLAKVAAALVAGGAWIFQTVNWDHVLGLAGATYRFPDRVVAGDLVFRREYRDITESRLRFRTELAAADRIIFSGEVDLHPTRADEYRRLHEAAGFAIVEHTGDFAGAPFRPDAAGGSVFVCRRPAA
jgi:SAM-dependent methyltransferase